MLRVRRHNGMITCITLVGMICGALLFYGTIARAQTPEQKKLPVLAPCTRDDPAYQTVDFLQKPFNEWPKAYHETVDKIIEEHMKTPELECDAENYNELLKPGTQLVGLAKSLPPWSSQQSQQNLKQSDMSVVLLEYLRVYECSLLEHNIFAPAIAIRERIANNTILDYFRADHVEDLYEKIDVIKKEIKTARPTLYYTLNLLSSYDRLRPLQAEIDCVQRASLDIRNVTALSAEVSACLPRIWSPKDPLRDIK